MSKLISEYDKSVPAPARALPHARLHDLRHLHATTLLLDGGPVPVVAARLGQADPAVTLRVYSHVVREQGASIGDFMRRPSGLHLANPLADHGVGGERASVCPARTSGQGRD